MRLRKQLVSMVAMASACVLLPVAGLYFVSAHVEGVREYAKDAHAELGAKLELAALVEGYFRAQRDASMGFGAAASTPEPDRRRSVLEAFERAQYSRGQLGSADEAEGAESEELAALRRDFVALADAALQLGQFDAQRAREFELLYEQRFGRDFVPRLFAAATEEQAELSEALEELDEDAEQAGWLGTLSLLLGTLGLFGMARWLGGGVNRDLTRLLDASRALSSGALQTRVAALPISEFDELGHSFNAMASSLEQSLDAKVRVEKLAAVGQLAASVSHEIRNPLAAARNALAYLRRRQAQTPLGGDRRFAEFIELADRELGACNRIVTDLLDFARERPLNLTACLLAPLCAEVLDVAQGRPGVEVTSRLDTDLPPVDADRDQLRQLLLNLVQNAIEAIPAERAGQVSLLASLGPEHVELSVRDDGSGIPEAERNRIFEPLVTTKTKGTGLGLAITRAIVTRHGWGLELDSELGKGTTFRLRIPVPQQIERRAAE